MDARWFGSQSGAGAEDEGAVSAELLRRLGVVVFRRTADSTLRFERADGRCAELLGVSTATLTGDAYSFWSHVVPEDRARALDVLQEAVRKGGSYRVEYRLRATTGRVHRVAEEGAAIEDPDGDEGVIALEGLITRAGSAVDGTVDGGRAPPLAAQDGERRYRALAAHSNEMVAEIASDGRIGYASPRLCDELGLAPRALVGRDPRELVHPQDRAHVDTAWRDVLRDGRAGKVLCRLERFDGSFIWAELGGGTYETAAGDTRGIVTGHNVSNRIRIEETFLAQRAAEARIARLSRRFLELGSEELDSAIREGLDAAAEIAAADQCYLLDFSRARAGDGGGDRSRVRTYSSAGDAPGVVEWARGEGPRHDWMRELLVRGEVVRIPRLAELPAELAETRGVLERRGIKSFCAIPVRSGGVVTALLGVHSFHSEHQWTEQEVALLRLVAELFASALKRRDAEGALRDGEQRLRAITDGAQDAICETEIGSGRILYANPRFYEMLGHDPEESAGMCCYGVMHDEDLAKIHAMESAFVRGELGDAASGTLLYRARHTRHGWRWLEANGRMFSTAGGELRTASVIRDVTDREVSKQAMARRLGHETLLARLARRLLALGVDDLDGGLRGGLESLEPIAGADRSWLVTEGDADVAGPRLWQWDRDGVAPTTEGLATLVPDLASAADALRDGHELCLKAADLAQGAPERALMETRGARTLLALPLLSGSRLVGVLGFERLDDDEGWSDEAVALLRLAGGTFASALSRHGTEAALRESRSQLLQAQKMEAVGTLAGGVAHDFNNQLSVILGNSRYVRGEIAEGSDLAEALIDLERAGEHCAQLTRSLLSFSRQTPSSRQPVPVSRVVADAQDLIRPLMPPDIEIFASVHDETHCVLADPTQLQQVLVNLMVNARDAMPGGGELRFTTALRKIDGAAAERLGLAAAGDYVEFALADTGIGMDEATMARVFEPFFTTKLQGQGTGLGLATVYGLVRDCNGTVSVESELGRGSTFRLLLPLYEGEDAERASHDGESERPTAGGRVLVVEDEQAVRRLMCRMLDATELDVVAAADGAEALALVDSETTPFDVLMTDVSMPRLGGVELARRVRERLPDVRVVLVTGSDADGSEIPGARVLRKPFSSAQLLAVLRELLA